MTTITDHLLQIFEIVLGGFGVRMYSDWLDRKRIRRQTDDPSDDYSRKKTILPILEDVKYEMDADRVHEWVFSNGDTTLSGHHLKKMSIFLEVNREEFDDIAHHFQFVPTKKLERLLDQLAESKAEYIVSHEYLKYDELAALNAQYDIKTILMIRIKNEFGKWTGILSVCFNDDREISESEIAFAKLQGARIGQIK
jgi:hypothetical protein